MQDFLDERALTLYRRYHEAGDAHGLLDVQRFDATLRAVHPGDWRASFPPPLFRAGAVDWVGEACKRLLDLVYSLPQRLFGGDVVAMLQAQGMSEHRIADIAPFCTPALLERARLFARPDALLTREGFQLVEMNVTPSLGGLGICDRYAAEIRDDPLGKRLLADGVAISAPDMAAHFVRVMARAAHAGTPGHRVMLELIADPAEDADANWARPDFISTARRAGFEVVTAKPADVALRTDGVYALGRRIDLAYTDHVYAEHLMHGHDNSLICTLVDAEARGLIDLISVPHACALYDNKANIALLTEPAYAACFTPEEQALIAAYVPRTHVLSPALVERCIDERQRLVLKPGLGLCGHDVAFGRQLDDASWKRALEAALASGESWVVQALVDDLWTYSLPNWGANERRMVCLGPLVFDGAYTGTFLREDWYAGRPVVVNHAQGARWCAGLQATPA